MEELIKLDPGNPENPVSARDLHDFLESKQDFSTWIKNRIKKYGFVENEDYVRLHKKMEANNATSIEYALTLDTAKELAMVEANAKGKQARQYFIECEKKLRSNAMSSIGTAHDIADHLYGRGDLDNQSFNLAAFSTIFKELSDLRMEVKSLKALGPVQVDNMKFTRPLPSEKVEEEEEFMSVTAYIRKYTKKAFVHKFDVIRLSREINQYCINNGLAVRNTMSDKYPNGVNHYPVNVLSKFLK